MRLVVVVCLCVALCAHVRLSGIGIGSCHLLPVFLSTKDANNNSHNESKYIQIYVFIFLTVATNCNYNYQQIFKNLTFLWERRRGVCCILFAVPTFLDQFKIQF